MNLPENYCQKCGIRIGSQGHLPDCPGEDSSPAAGSSRERLMAKMSGAIAALEGKKIDANNYPESSEKHWLWLEGWTSAHEEMNVTENPRQP